MHLRVIDLDGAVAAQTQLIRRFNPRLLDFSGWGSWLRLTCRFNTFRRFQEQLATSTEAEPGVSLLGSGDFHHVTLALLRQLTQPFNLLVIDKHPDWMRGIPVMHCGTWLWHALRLPQLKRVIHIGGDLDFDNLYRFLAPWSELRSGRIKVIPAYRQYRRGEWNNISHRPLMRPGDCPSVAEVLSCSLRPCLSDLARWPLYISLDKDAMSAEEAVVNWDSGTLGFREIDEILDWFQEASQGQLAGMDVVGDWSPVHLQPGLRTLCHWIEHPKLFIDANRATSINQRVNEAIVNRMLNWQERRTFSAQRLAA